MSENDLKALNKHANDLLSVDLTCVLQPGYGPKSRQFVDAMLTFVAPVKAVLMDPAKIHSTAIDTSLKNLQALGKTLPEEARQAHEQSFKAVLADIKKLRTEVPRKEMPQTTKPSAKI
jgi:hypothetical protein